MVRSSHPNRRQRGPPPSSRPKADEEEQISLGRGLWLWPLCPGLVGKAGAPGKRPWQGREDGVEYQWNVPLPLQGFFWNRRMTTTPPYAHTQRKETGKKHLPWS